MGEASVPPVRRRRLVQERRQLQAFLGSKAVSFRETAPIPLTVTHKGKMTALIWDKRVRTGRHPRGQDSCELHGQLKPEGLGVPWVQPSEALYSTEGLWGAGEGGAASC